MASKVYVIKLNGRVNDTTCCSNHSFCGFFSLLIVITI